MNISKNRLKFLIYIYNKYHNNEESFADVGDLFANLVEESGIDLGGEEANIAEFTYFLDNKIIKFVEPKKHDMSSHIIPTSKCVDTIDQLGQSWVKKNWPSLITALAEGTTKALIKTALNT